ncbi:efflux RND transporter periplasmic adaptor subunit [Patescibacteria group bacterium]|nr:efflux RND transporter periplasmic adaptor subunit [Patescibacteria group bacterium]
MGRVTRIIFFLVFVCVAISGTWVYVKYIRPDAVQEVVARAERTDLEELVTEQAELVSDEEYVLGFSTPGTIARVFVSEGDAVRASDPLVALDTAELEFDRRRLAAVLASRTAELGKLESGLSAEDRAVLDAETVRLTSALRDLERTELLAIRSVYTTLDSALRASDLLFSNASSNTPELSFDIADSALKNRITTERVALGSILLSARTRADTASTSTIADASSRMLEDARRMSIFLDDVSRALGSAASSRVSDTTLDVWRGSIAAARVSVNEAALALSSASGNRVAAAQARALHESDRAARLAPPRSEDLATARAAVTEAENAVLAVAERIRMSTLRAPQAGTVIHVEHRTGESYRLGERAVVLTVPTPHLESEISELDIARIKVGQSATATFDALPGERYAGKVVFIDPQRVEKDTDTYYVVHVALDAPSEALRPGMTADLTVRVSERSGVLVVPEYAPFKKGDAWFVLRRDASGTVEAPVTLGISDGERREILTGLEEGDSVVIPAE